MMAGISWNEKQNQEGIDQTTRNGCYVPSQLTKFSFCMLAKMEGDCVAFT